MFFMNKDDAAGRIRRADWVALARQHKVPALLDAAADVPPAERLSEYNRMGFDLVAFSGGKAMRSQRHRPAAGPHRTHRRSQAEHQSKLRHHWPGPQGLQGGHDRPAGGRGTLPRLDHKAEVRKWERHIEVIEQAVRAIPSVRCERIVPLIANHVPHLIITWDEKRVHISRERFTRALADSDPPIQIGRVPGTGERGVVISVFTLQPGEEKIVAGRVQAILRNAEKN